jgi:hypothetical protein
MVFFMVSDHLPGPGEKIRAIIDGRHIHLFDREKGERITTGEPPYTGGCVMAD